MIYAQSFASSPGRATASMTILSGQSLSAAIDLGINYMASRLVMPAVWTPAGVSFKVSNDGVTYNELRDTLSALLGLTVGASYDIALDPAIFMGARYLMARSGPSTLPVNQLQDSILTLSLVPI